MRALITVAFCILLTGCEPLTVKTVGSSGDYGEYPTNYADIAHDWIRLNFRDPESVKDLEISQPVKYVWIDAMAFKKTYCYMVPFRCNAKNGYGGYTGLHDNVLYVRNGVVLQELDLSAP